MKRFLKIGVIKIKARSKAKLEFSAELKKLISFKQRLPLQYIH